jgi:oligosaccharide repeat unit polymerase
MFESRKKINKTIMAITAVTFLILLLIIGVFNNSEKVYVYNYVVDAVCLTVSVSLLLRLYIKKDLDMFEPIVVIGGLYILMYFFTPIYDLCIGQYTWYGYDLFKYGIKATLIAFAGFIGFYVFYEKSFVWGNRSRRLRQVNNYCYTNDYAESRKIILYLTLIIYFFSLAANIYYVIHVSGNSILYSLTFGLLGSGGVSEKTTTSIGFISMFSYCLPSATLLYWEFGNVKTMKWILFLIMFSLQMTRGFRFFIIAIAITFFAYYYIKANRRPKMKTILLAVLAIIFVVVFMTIFRSAIRTGNGVDFSQFNAENIKEAFDEAIWDNFRIYNNFYAMTDKIPSVYPYVHGRQMLLGTLAMVIPRAIWPQKISTKAGVGLEYIVGKALVDTGQAYPNIGEYYYAFGTIGVIVFMCIYGIYARRVKKCYFHSENALDIILYSVLLGANLQLIIRGYTPSNFWYLVFSILPVVIIKLLFTQRKTEVE